MKKNFLKRIISIALCAVMTVPFCITAYAETTDSSVIQTSTSDTAEDTSYYKYYGITKLPSAKTLDEDVKNEIIDDYLKTVNVDGKEYTREDITLDYYGYYGDLGNFSILVHIENPDTVHNDEIHYVPIGDRIYVYTTGTDVVIYRDNAFYSIVELIATGEFTDEDARNVCSTLQPESFISQSDLKSLLMIVQTVGDTYTPETAEPFYAAVEKANALVEAENPSYRDLTLAYYELEETAANLELLVVDKSELSRCYDYCQILLDNFKDYYDEETRKLISSTKSDAQFTILYPQNEEYFYSTTDKIVEVVKTIKPITENPDIPSYEDILKMDEIADSYLKSFSLSENTEYYYGYMPEFLDFNGYKIYYARFDVVEPMTLTMRDNGYIFENKSQSRFYPSLLSYIVINVDTEDVMTLEDAIAQEIVDTDRLYEYMTENLMSFNMYLIGDCDNDGALSIKDATLVQKASIGLEEIVSTYNETDTVFDYNGDGTVNISDATGIQKSIVS